MKVEIVDPPPLKHDPWEEDCCGAHNGQTVVITDHKLVITVKELITGIGNSYTIQGTWEGQKTRAITIQVSDDGELLCS